MPKAQWFAGGLRSNPPLSARIQLNATLVLAIAGSVCLVRAQVPAERAVIEAEEAREAGVPALLAAAKSSDMRLQSLAARAIGRLENPAYRDALIPLLQSPDPLVRRAAVGAMAQLRAPFEYRELLQTERDASVRAVIYEAVGRAKPVAADAETLLIDGLSDPDPRGRAGAARGLESLFRLNAEPPLRPSAATIAALHQAFVANQQKELRELILLTMNRAGDHDSSTLAIAITDPSAQVRRLAVMGTGTWIRDASPMVQYEALRAAPSCEHAAAAVNEISEHVALAAVDLLGSLKCDAGLIAPIVKNEAKSERSWRFRAHALVALAAVDPAQARTAMAGMLKDPTWQVRAYVAQAARVLNDSEALATLARDANPNVAVAALTTPEDATRAIASDHSGLIRAGAERLKNVPDLKDRLPQLMAAFNRLTEGGSMTVRDPRVALLTRIGEVKSASSNGLLGQALGDRDPAIAALAAQILNKRTGSTVAPQTTRLPVPKIPPAEYILGLNGARARFTMHGLGAITVDLLTDEAPVTVGVFAQLAEAGQYNGLTFHRIVPNFVIQGGSPGADEYDARSREFMRDEVGLVRHLRGTIGISTRGRDTGDAQIFFNLVDNFRLDHDYTVFAATSEGLDVMDRVQEGDVIDRIEIIRKHPGLQRTR
jgi:cyclophilin family peptidyl-prolyl cis-trans isomerase/HEAT repeat protein